MMFATQTLVAKFIWRYETWALFSDATLNFQHYTNKWNLLLQKKHASYYLKITIL